MKCNGYILYQINGRKELLTVDEVQFAIKYFSESTKDFSVEANESIIKQLMSKIKDEETAILMYQAARNNKEKTVAVCAANELQKWQASSQTPDHAEETIDNAQFSEAINAYIAWGDSDAKSTTPFDETITDYIATFCPSESNTKGAKEIHLKREMLDSLKEKMQNNDSNLFQNLQQVGDHIKTSLGLGIDLNDSWTIGFYALHFFQSSTLEEKNCVQDSLAQQCYLELHRVDKLKEIFDLLKNTCEHKCDSRMYGKTCYCQGVTEIKNLQDQKIPDTEKLKKIASITTEKQGLEFCKPFKDPSKAYSAYTALRTCFSENFATMGPLKKNTALESLVGQLKNIVNPPKLHDEPGGTCFILEGGE